MEERYGQIFCYSVNAKESKRGTFKRPKKIYIYIKAAQNISNTQHIEERILHCFAFTE